jgi:hypothetical protein
VRIVSSFVLIVSTLVFVFPTLSIFVVIVAVCIRILNIQGIGIDYLLAIPAAFGFSHVPSKFGHEFNVGWTLLFSSLLLLLVEMSCKVVQQCARRVVLLIQRWNGDAAAEQVEARHEPYSAAIAMGAVGAMLLLDNELRIIGMVLPVLRSTSLFKFPRVVTWLMQKLTF